MTEPRLCACGCGQFTKPATRTNRRYGHVKGQPTPFLLGHSGGKGKGKDRLFRDAENQTCSVCKVLKPLSEFHRNRSRPAGYGTECKLCVLERMRARYSADPEAYREKSQRWRKANPEKVKQGRSEHYARNAEAMRAYNRRAYRADSERRSARARAWNKANRTQARETGRLYREANRDKMRAYYRIVTLRRRGVRHPDTDACDYLAVVCGDPCSYCASPTETVDHIVPLAKGGDNSWDNLTSACRSCNSRKQDRSMLTFLVARMGP